MISNREIASVYPSGDVVLVVRAPPNTTLDTDPQVPAIPRCVLCARSFKLVPWIAYWVGSSGKQNSETCCFLETSLLPHQHFSRFPRHPICLVHNFRLLDSRFPSKSFPDHSCFSCRACSCSCPTLHFEWRVDFPISSFSSLHSIFSYTENWYCRWRGSGSGGLFYLSSFARWEPSSNVRGWLWFRVRSKQ